MKLTPIIILKAVFFGALFFLLDKLTGIIMVHPNIRVTYAYPLLAFASVVMGPIAGALAGLVGQVMVQLSKTVPNWIPVLCTVLDCVFIGLTTRHFDLKNGFFGRKEVMEFNLRQFLSNILFWGILQPVLQGAFKYSEYADAFREGYWTVINHSVSSLVMASLMLAMYARSRISPANFYRN